MQIFYERDLPKGGSATKTKPAVNKRPLAKTTNAQRTEPISEQDIAELNRLGQEMNARLDRIHETMQDIITDLRAARGILTP